MRQDPGGLDRIRAVRQACLVRAVPVSARSILEIGCGEGDFGAALKAQELGRIVRGVERDPETAHRAAGRVDEMFVLDWEAHDPPVGPGSIDCIVYGEALQQAKDPLRVLLRHAPLLRPGGCIVCLVSNVQHSSMLQALLTGDWSYASKDPQDPVPLRFFSVSTIDKLLLDAGYAPEILAAINIPCPPEILQAAKPLLTLLRLHPPRMQEIFGAYEYVVRATRYAAPVDLPTDPKDQEVEPLTFAVCVNDEQQLKANLLSSPCLSPPTGHQVLTARGCGSMAECVERCLPQARHEWLVCVHQDVYLPAGWDRRFVRQLRLAQAAFGPLGVAGVCGVARTPTGFARVAHILDRGLLLHEPIALPAAVETLDEVVLAVRKDAGLRFDPALGFHLYGADICLEAQQRGLACAAVDALCLHNSRNFDLPPQFADSGKIFAQKWAAKLPVATSCVRIDKSGQMVTW